MDPLVALPHLTMRCPRCATDVAPCTGTHDIVAWYDCPECGQSWSARIRNGHPDTDQRLDAPALTTRWAKRIAG